MRKHQNPHSIRDHKNWFEVTENSSHPELDDAKRVWKFGGYSFESATALDKFFISEGLDFKQYAYDTRVVREFGKNTIFIYIVPKHQSTNARGLRSLTA